MNATTMPAGPGKPPNDLAKRPAAMLVALRPLNGDRKRTVALIITLACLSLVFLACATGHAASNAHCYGNSCWALPGPVSEPVNASLTIDREREALLKEVRIELTDHYLDHVYLKALGDVAADYPDHWASAIADRVTHDACVSHQWGEIHATTAPDAAPADPEEQRSDRARRLRECLLAGDGDWNAAPPAQRALWVSHGLLAARRITTPAESARPYIRQEEQDAGWIRLDEEFAPCREIIGPEADNVAIRDASLAAAAFLDALATTMTCANRLTTSQEDAPDAGSPQ